MNTDRLRLFSAILLGPVLLATGGCKHREKGVPKPATPVTETQAPVKKIAPSSFDLREKQLQGQIDSMQEQIRVLTARTEALAGFHRVRMGPKWVEKVEKARADASRPSERMRYLEATQALLARKLDALRAEMKVYQEFESSDPSIPRQ